MSADDEKTTKTVRIAEDAFAKDGDDDGDKTANGKDLSPLVKFENRRPSLRCPNSLVVNRKKYVEPPDGGWGWVIVLAVWVDNVLVIGMLKSFGVLFPPLRVYFNQSAAAISWINSISLSMRATAAPLSAALSNRYGERKVVAAGGVLVFVGLIISVFATSPYYLYLSLGCITGMGFAFASLPALTMIGRYFSKRRSLANGLSRCGGGATFFLAPLLQLLVQQYGWQGCLLILAGVELHLIAIALLLRPLRLKTELEFNPNETLQRHRSSSVGQQASGARPRPLTDEQRVKQMQRAIAARVDQFGVTESLIVDHFPTIEPVYEVKRSRTLDFALLKNPLWAVMTANLVLTQMGYTMMLVHTVARAKLMGIPDAHAPLLLSFFGLAEVVAQLTSGWFADKGLIRRINLHKIYVAVMAVATLCSLAANSFATMAVYCVVFGCGSGSWQGNILPVTIDTLGLAKLRSAYGFCLFFSGVCGQLIGPPIAGALYDATSSYNYSFILATCLFAAASLVLWLEIPADKYVRRRRARKQSNGTERADEEQFDVLKEELRHYA